MSFIFGGDTKMTYEQAKRQQDMARQLMAQNKGRSQNSGQGIASFTEQITNAIMGRRANKEMDRQKSEFDDRFKQAYPQAAGSQAFDMYSDPRASDSQRDIIKALNSGVPGFRYGTRSAPGGMAVVGEDGPELVNLPQGAQVVPNPMTPIPTPPMENYMQPPPGGFRAPFDPGNELDDAPPQDDLQKLLGPMQQEASRFRDDEAYQTAQAGGDIAPPDAPVPTQQELQEIGQRVGINPEALRGLDLNATEAKNFGYVLRMMEAEKTIRDLEGSNTLGQRALEWLPGKEIESMLMKPEYRRYTLARENFNEAALRAATGATINRDEMPMQRENYFPLPTDDEETKDLLRRQRQALMMALTAGSGPAAAIVPEYGQAVVPSAATRDLGALSNDDLMKMLQGGG